MKTRSVALAAHQERETTSLTQCLRVESKFGLVRGVNMTSRSFDYLGETYNAREGVNPAAIESSADGAVQNTEVTGFLSEDFATEEEIVGGIWDNAFVSLFEVNYRDLSMGHMGLQSGWLGQISAGRTMFNAELRSLAQALQQQLGDVYSPMCRAKLGDSMCKVDVEALRVASTLTAVATRRTFTDTARGEASDWFGAGLLTVLEGPYAGMLAEIHGFVAGVYTLALPLPFDPWVGMSYSVIPGCRKRHERGGLYPAGVSDCRDKFDNVVNFQGEPPSMFPGNNRILGLGSLVGQQS